MAVVVSVRVNSNQPQSTGPQVFSPAHHTAHQEAVETADKARGRGKVVPAAVKELNLQQWQANWLSKANWWSKASTTQQYCGADSGQFHMGPRASAVRSVRKEQLISAAVTDAVLPGLGKAG